jgi:hypothetical protein
VLLLLVPAASASTLTLSFSPTFGVATMEAEGVLDGDDARLVRGYMDANRDGTVTAQEATQFLAFARGLIGAQVARMLGGGNLTLDGEAAVGSELGNVTFDDAAGAVQGGPPMPFRLDMRFLFAPEEAKTHTLRLVGNPTPGGALEMRIHAPSGWRVASVTGATALVGSMATFVMPTGGEEVLVAFEPTKKANAPGFALAAVSVGAAAVTLRLAGRRT